MKPKVNNDGYTFELNPEYTSLFEVNIEPQNVLKLQNSFIRKLLLLVDEEIAIWDENNFQVTLPHASIYKLEREELDILGIPEFYPYGFGFSVSDRIMSQNFSLQLDYKRSDEDVIVNPAVSGSYIKVSSSEEYIFDSESYELHGLLNELKESGDDRNKKLVYISKIADKINDINEKVPEQLSSYDLEELDTFDLHLEEDEDGSISVYPVPVHLGSDEKEKVLSDEEEKEFHKQFQNQQNVRGQYLLRGKKLLVYNKTKKNDQGEEQEDDVLSQFKKLQKLEGKEKKAFIDNPEMFFPESTRVDLSDFSDRVKSIGQYVPVVLPFIMQSENDWFPEEGGLIIDGERILLPLESRDELIRQIQDGLETGIKTIEYNGREFNVNEETLEALHKLKKAEKSKKSDVTTQEETLGASQNTILIIKDNFFELEQRGKLDEERDGSVSLPLSINDSVKLYPHQEDGLHWLQNLWIKGRNGALLADDMGLGKTIQALLFCAWVKEQKLKMGLSSDDIASFIVVAPVALLENWSNEYHKFLEWETFKEPLILHGPTLKQFKLENDLGIRNEREIDSEEYEIEKIISEKGGLLFDIAELRKHQFILTTYETIRDYQFSLSKINWSVMVLDEIQKIKNPKTLISHAVKAMNYNFGLGLTGTPVENSWVDLWNIMDFVQPGHLGPLVDFNESYAKKLDDPDVDRYKLGEALKSDIGELLRRRFKEDHLDGLPEKKEIKIRTELTDYQKEIYSQVLERAADANNDEHTLTQLAAIRDISLCPYLPFKNENSIENIPLHDIVSNSAKIQEAFEILDDVKVKNEKAIIFLISRKTQAVLQRLIIEKYGFKAYIINGTVSGGRRQKLVDKFQDQTGFNVIIMSPEAAGVGLNVTAANHVIHLSRHWNPAKEDQASDRVYRIGQNKDVKVHIPIATFPELGEGKSFDEILDKLLSDKRHLSRSVLIPAKVEKSELLSIQKEFFSDNYQPKKVMNVTMRDIDDLSGHQFEHFCKILYTKLGYSVDWTDRSRDKGVDLIVKDVQNSRGMLIQCKSKDNHNKRVDQAGVQEVFSGKNYYSSLYSGIEFELVVLTNSVGYTGGAIELAKTNSVNLLDRSFLKKYIKETNFGWNDLVSVNSSN